VFTSIIRPQRIGLYVGHDVQFVNGRVAVFRSNTMRSTGYFGLISKSETQMVGETARPITGSALSRFGKQPVYG